MRVPGLMFLMKPQPLPRPNVGGKLLFKVFDERSADELRGFQHICNRTVNLGCQCAVLRFQVEGTGLRAPMLGSRFHSLELMFHLCLALKRIRPVRS